MGGQQGRRLRPFLARRIADSADLRATVEAAHNLGISVKRFNGWTPAEEHVHEYAPDENGVDRLVRTVVHREAEWDDQERGWALAWLLYRANVHEACGHYLPDSTDPAADDGYEVEAAIRCHACTARAQAYARYEDSRHPQALLFVAQRKRR